jgi:hypothetical protein
MKNYLKKLVFSNGLLRRIYFSALVFFGRAYGFKAKYPVQFDGWGMVSVNKPPWESSENAHSTTFVNANAKIYNLVEQGKINLSQFNKAAVLVELKQLEWRHYIVYSSILLTGISKKSKDFVAVELGVCDGLTAAYAISAMKTYIGQGAKIYLVDAWQAMRELELVNSEKNAVGAYSYLSLQNTKNNLDNFIFDSIYIKGYVPEVLTKSEMPQYLDWLHIDLNASQPTVAAMDFFWERIRVGGLVLLDDYGFIGYDETRKAVDDWVNKNNAFLLTIPTGQALVFKH